MKCFSFVFDYSFEYLCKFLRCVWYRNIRICMRVYMYHILQVLDYSLKGFKKTLTINLRQEISKYKLRFIKTIQRIFPTVTHLYIIFNLIILTLILPFQNSVMIQVILFVLNVIQNCLWCLLGVAVLSWANKHFHIHKLWICLYEWYAI